MDLSKNPRDTDRFTQTLLAVGLSVFALLSLRRGKRLRGVLAGAGAVALGYSASTEPGDVVEQFAVELDTVSTTDDDQLRCAACGEPIVPGQNRGPNGNDETVHGSCLESSL
jgi:hypothetical protein